MTQDIPERVYPALPDSHFIGLGELQSGTIPLWTAHQLHAYADPLMDEIEALRELLNCYNLGGWTDSLRLIKERNELRATIERQQGVMRMAQGALTVWADLIRFQYTGNSAAMSALQNAGIFGEQAITALQAELEKKE